MMRLMIKVMIIFFQLAFCQCVGAAEDSDWAVRSQEISDCLWLTETDTESGRLLRDLQPEPWELCSSGAPELQQFCHLVCGSWLTVWPHQVQPYRDNCQSSLVWLSPGSALEWCSSSQDIKWAVRVYLTNEFFVSRGITWPQWRWRLPPLLTTRSSDGGAAQPHCHQNKISISFKKQKTRSLIFKTISLIKSISDRQGSCWSGRLWNTTNTSYQPQPSQTLTRQSVVVNESGRLKIL